MPTIATIRTIIFITKTLGYLKAQARIPTRHCIIVHGTSFHSGELNVSPALYQPTSITIAIFKRLLPLAAQHNIRLVLLNRRDYPGSSPYTEEELDGLKSGDETAQMAFGKARALEFGTFIHRFVGQEGIPRMAEDGKDGGVVLMAWSSGTMYSLPLLSYADVLSDSMREALEPYFRRYIIFESSRLVFGLPTSTEGGSFLVHPSVSKEESQRSFNDWVSSYYIHKSITSMDDADLQVVPSADAPPSTLQRMSEEELIEVTTPEAIDHSEIPARTAKAEIFAERTRRALFDDDMAAKFFPRCSVEAIYCEQSLWAMIDAVWALKRLKEKANEEGVKGRPLRVHIIPKANHFPHWDYPEDAMKFFVDVIRS